MNWPGSHRFWNGIAALGAAILIVGCASSSSNSAADSRSQTLHEYREALTRIRTGNYAEARTLLDSAITTLGGLTAGDPTARKARGYFREESAKNFRGEPYERAMAFYYRGLLYWMDGQLDNARACFRSAAFEDSDAAAGYRADFVLFDYLDGLATAKLGASGDEAFQRARASARWGPPAPYDVKANVLFFLDFGAGPQKVAGGKYGELLQYEPGRFTAVAARVRVGAKVVQANTYDDLTFQATTRGGRVMDQILANKAAFKTGTDVFGNSALISGGILAATQQGRGTAADEIGAGLMIAGVISKVISAATTPKADTRTWDNLPNLLGFAALSLPPGPHTATIEFLDPRSARIQSKSVSFQVEPGRDAVVLVSDRAP